MLLVDTGTGGAKCSGYIQRTMLLQDIRFGCRHRLEKQGGDGLAVVCLAIGIGLNTMMFSVTDGVLIQPLPYPAARPPGGAQPDQQAARYSLQQLLAARTCRNGRERTHSFSAIAGAVYHNFTVSDGGDTDPIPARPWATSSSPLLGVAPQLGRDFNADDDRHGGEPVVMLSDDMWRRRYNADPVYRRTRDPGGRAAAHRHRRDAAALPVSREPVSVAAARRVRHRRRAARARMLSTFARLKDGVSLALAQTGRRRRHAQSRRRAFPRQQGLERPASRRCATGRSRATSSAAS